MSRDDLIQLEGVVSRVLGGGTLEIACENNVTITRNTRFEASKVGGGLRKWK